MYTLALASYLKLETMLVLLKLPPYHERTLLWIDFDYSLLEQVVHRTDDITRVALRCHLYRAYRIDSLYAQRMYSIVSCKRHA